LPNPANTSPQCSMCLPTNLMTIPGCCWLGTAAIARRCCRRYSRRPRGRGAKALGPNRCGARVLGAPKLAVMGLVQKLNPCRPGGQRDCDQGPICASSPRIPCPPIRPSGRCNDWGPWSYLGRRRICRSAWRSCIGGWWRSHLQERGPIDLRSPVDIV
jgi:hypothetical protein